MARIRLAVLDVDGTLKQAESPYQYLHRRLGVSHLAAEHRTLALSGQISYGEWLRRDVALWAGQPVAELRRLLAENPFLPGASELLRTLKSCSVVVALVTAGFTLNTDPIVVEYGIDYVLANELLEENGCLTGVAINHVPEGGKAAFACDLMQRLGIPAEETLAAGDTRGDLELFECAGVRMAVNPVSPELAARADVVLTPDLRGAVEWLVARGHLAPPEST
ncbi:MAG: HAD family hydrolase [Nitrososphaerales archaeon]